MHNVSRDVGSEVLTNACPRCGAHLGDTWDEDDQECINCGFAYVHVRYRFGPRSSPSPSASPRWQLASAVLAVVGMLLVFFAGALHTSPGPDASFEAIVQSSMTIVPWLSGGMLLVAFSLGLRSGGDR